MEFQQNPNDGYMPSSTEGRRPQRLSLSGHKPEIALAPKPSPLRLHKRTKTKRTLAHSEGFRVFVGHYEPQGTSAPTKESIVTT
jgi:hypothetical protein